MLVADVEIFRVRPGSLAHRGYVHPNFDIQEILQQFVFNFGVYKKDNYRLRVTSTIMPNTFKFEVDPED